MRQLTSPGGIPAASAASIITRTAASVQVRAEGCGATMHALRALTLMRILKIAVDVGFVEGVSATTTPTGQPISTTLRSVSLRSTPHVLTSLIESQTARAANSFLIRLCSGRP